MPFGTCPHVAFPVEFPLQLVSPMVGVASDPLSRPQPLLAARRADFRAEDDPQLGPGAQCCPISSLGAPSIPVALAPAPG